MKQHIQFGVSHYAGPVYYDAYGMLDKNRDRVHQDVFDTFDVYGMQLLQEVRRYLPINLIATSLLMIDLRQVFDVFLGSHSELQRSSRNIS